jgi:uncharacterized protein (DUF362 family)
MKQRPFGFELSRRQFLSTLALAGAATSCRQLPLDRRAFDLPARSAVALLPAADYQIDFADTMARGLALFQPEVRGRSVLLKPNVVEYQSGTVINTHPLVVAGAAVAFKRLGAREVVVGEGPGHRRDIEYLLTATGLYDHLRDLDVRFVDLNHDELRKVRLASNFTGLGELSLPRAILEADVVVSMPKLKTHHWAGLTCGMKNLFGVVPGAAYGWPKNLLHVRGIVPSILDLAATVRPNFTIVDGVVGMEGDGPIMGQPRAVGLIAMGPDVVAVDSTCARIIGIDPMKVPYLSVAAEFLGNLTSDKIDQRGEPLQRYQTQFDLIDRMQDLRLSA